MEYSPDNRHKIYGDYFLIPIFLKRNIKIHKTATMITNKPNMTAVFTASSITPVLGTLPNSSVEPFPGSLPSVVFGGGLGVGETVGVA
jgi:hypothetical protein